MYSSCPILYQLFIHYAFHLYMTSIYILKNSLCLESKRNICYCSSEFYSLQFTPLRDQVNIHVSPEKFLLIGSSKSGFITWTWLDSSGWAIKLQTLNIPTELMRHWGNNNSTFYLYAGQKGETGSTWIQNLMIWS